MPGRAMAARFFSSPNVLAKHDTPQMLPTYFPIPRIGMSFRIRNFSLVLMDDSGEESLCELILLNFKTDNVGIIYRTVKFFGLFMDLGSFSNLTSRWLWRNSSS